MTVLDFAFSFARITKKGTIESDEHHLNTPRGNKAFSNGHRYKQKETGGDADRLVPMEKTQVQSRARRLSETEANWNFTIPEHWQAT